MGLFFKMIFATAWTQAAARAAWGAAIVLGAAVFGLAAPQALAYDITEDDETVPLAEPYTTIEREATGTMRGDDFAFAISGSTAFAVGDTLDIALSDGATFVNNNFSLEESAGGAGTGDLTFATLETTNSAGESSIRFTLKNANDADPVSGVAALILSGNSFAGQSTYVNLPPTYGTDVYVTFTLRDSIGALKGSVRHLVFESTLPPSPSAVQSQQEIQNVLSAHARFMTSESAGLSDLLTGRGFDGANAASLFGNALFGDKLSGDMGSIGTALAATAGLSLPVSMEMTGGQGKFAASLAHIQAWDGALGVGDEKATDTPPSPLAERTSPFNVWVKGRWQGVTDTRGGTDGDGRFGLMMVGADYRYDEDTLFGLLAQVDTYDQTATGRSTKAKGDGWMAGPYLVTRPFDNLIWDARIAWGMARNQINFSDYGWDKYESIRWQGETNLTGEMKYQGWDILPQVGLSMFEETPKAYKTRNGTEVKSESVLLGSLSFGPEVSRTWEQNYFEDVTVRPSAALKGIWDFNSPVIVHNDSSTVSTERLRAKLELGGTATFEDARIIYARYAFDGIGVAGYQSHSLELAVSTPVEIGFFADGGNLKSSFSQSVSTTTVSSLKFSLEVPLN